MASSYFADVIHATDILVTNLARDTNLTMKACERCTVTEQVLGRNLSATDWDNLRSSAR